jgi:peptidoglycan/xylan/chitin deacetylase (PgdA/CDA1 family)
LFYLRRASAPQIFGEAVRHVNTKEQVMALTFDDGPNPESTERILSLLEEYDAKATFFVIGQNAEKYPEIVQKIYAGGNEVGNHSWSHERLILKTPRFIRDQIDKTDGLLKNLRYEGVIHFRAPYGHKLFILPYILMKENRKNILWDIELNDWDNPSPEMMMEVFDKKAAPGSVILLHDGYTGERQSREETVSFVEMLLRKYTGLGYRFVTVSELLEAEE